MTLIDLSRISATYSIKGMLLSTRTKGLLYQKIETQRRNRLGQLQVI